MQGKTHPIMSCAEAQAFEEQLLGKDEEASWAAMQRAGHTTADLIADEWKILGGQPKRLLILLGKGHNGGDACIAAGRLAELYPGLEVEVILSVMEQLMRPLTRRALVVLKSELEDRITLHETLPEDKDTQYDIVIDGLLGMGFKPPVKDKERDLIDFANSLEGVSLRVAVDIPSGMGDSNDDEPFRADLTIATGIFKRPIIEPGATFSTGRRRYADIGFFEQANVEGFDTELLTSGIFENLKGLRPAASDKRSFGNVMVLAGSRGMIGAAAMTVKAALQAGAGLVTAFVPGQAVNAFSAAMPEAMWVPCPTDSNGIITLESDKLIEKHMERADAWVIGPGLGFSPDIGKMLRKYFNKWECPVVLDADALQEEIVLSCYKMIGNAKVDFVLTPHVGEYLRMTGNTDSRSTNIDDDRLLSFCSAAKVTTVLKGAVSRICDGQRIIYSPFGGPVLARGGSGDCLAGILGARLAMRKRSTLEHTCEAVAWHGRAAELLAQSRGENNVRTTDLLDYLPNVIRNG